MAKINKSIRKEKILNVALKLFSERGFYSTSIPDIAQEEGMSVGNFYNYFKSKEFLAKEIIVYISTIIGKKIAAINVQSVSTQEKIAQIVSMYFSMAKEQPYLLEFFLRVYLSNREVFAKECQGTACIAPFLDEMTVLFEDGVASGELENQDFYSAFGLFMGYLGGMVFLHGEKILPRSLQGYEESISLNIFNALKRRN